MPFSPSQIQHTANAVSQKNKPKLKNTFCLSSFPDHTASERIAHYFAVVSGAAKTQIFYKSVFWVHHRKLGLHFYLRLHCYLKADCPAFDSFRINFPVIASKHHFQLLACSQCKILTSFPDHAASDRNSLNLIVVMVRFRLCHVALPIPPSLLSSASL